jgi:hypothetical protein
MSCPNCGTAHERGRFCDRCGKRLPVAQAIRRVTLPRRPPARSETATSTSPGDGQATGSGRHGAAPRPADETADAGEHVFISHLAAVGRMYDAAMARAAVHGHRPLQRYVNVLIAPS